MLVLTMVFLVGLYVAKIFFPQDFMLVIQNENLVKVGTYIDTHKWLYYICCGIPAFITYWLFLCACSHRLRLKWYECFYILATVIINRLAAIYADVAITTAISLASFLFLPALCKGDIKACGIVYTVHVLAQALSLGIRNLPIYLTSINFMTSLFMTIECYFWLILFYVVFNYKKEKEIKKHGSNMSTTLR